jgi:hypothetical protein
LGKPLVPLFLRSILTCHRDISQGLRYVATFGRNGYSPKNKYFKLNQELTAMAQTMLYNLNTAKEFQEHAENHRKLRELQNHQGSFGWDD